MDRIDRYLNGTLAPEETQRLAQDLLNDPGLADQFADATRLEENLRSLMSESGRGQLFARRFDRAERSLATPRGRGKPPSRIARPLSAAAALAAILAVGYAAWSGKPPQPATAVTRHGRVTQGQGADSADLSSSAHARPRVATGMKRRLENFIVPDPSLVTSPVSAVLTALENQWNTLPHREPAEYRTVRFVVPDEVREAWETAGEEPLVSVDIPGISMMACLNLVAAQAGLVVETTDSGAVLTGNNAPAPPGERMWTFPMSTAELAACSRRISGGERSRSFEPGAEHLVWSSYYPGRLTSDIHGDMDRLAETFAAAKGSGSDGVELPGFQLKNAPEISEVAGTADPVNGELLTEAATDTGETVDFLAMEDRQDLTEISGKAYNYFQAGDSVGAMGSSLEKHGINPLCLDFDETSEILTARGTVPDLRKVSAFLSAARQSATSGISVEGMLVRYASGREGSAVRPPGIAPVSAADYRSEWLSLRGSPHSVEVEKFPREEVAVPNAGVSLHAAGGSCITVISAARSGELIQVKLRARARADEESGALESEVSIAPGGWIRIDLPDETQFLRVRPAAVPG